MLSADPTESKEVTVVFVWLQNYMTDGEGDENVSNRAFQDFLILMFKIFRTKTLFI